MEERGVGAKGGMGGLLLSSKQDSGCGRNEWNAAIIRAAAEEMGWTRRGGNAELANNDEEQKCGTGYGGIGGSW